MYMQQTPLNSGHHRLKYIQTPSTADTPAIPYNGHLRPVHKVTQYLVLR